MELSAQITKIPLPFSSPKPYPSLRPTRRRASASSSLSGGGGGGGGAAVGGDGGGGGGGGGEDAGVGAAAAAAAAALGETAAADTEAILLHVGGMSCGGCAASVKRILETQPEVSSATVDLENETAFVWTTPEAKATHDWQQQLGEKLANHLTTCGFQSHVQASWREITSSNLQWLTRLGFLLLNWQSKEKPSKTDLEPRRGLPARVRRQWELFTPVTSASAAL